jgi:methylated-DNA-[protein]-cysteine S-methyltransferase
VLTSTTVPTPVGDVLAVQSPLGVCGLAFADHADRLGRHLDRWWPTATPPRSAAAPTLAAAIAGYFDGDLEALTDVPVDLRGTPFQRAVWERLRRIPAGATATYADVAAAIGRPAAARAVGAANGANPVSLIVPCHRVVPASGGVGGYAGGSDRKAALLAHERTHRGIQALAS